MPYVFDSDAAPNAAKDRASAPGSVVTNGRQETTIVIRALSVCGKPPRRTAQGALTALKPLSHGPGGPHTVSVRLVALGSGYDEHTVRGWAETGRCFVRLDWGFPDCNYPRFTTRHLLTRPAASPADVSFSGGLGWAERMLAAFKQLNATGFSDPPPLPLSLRAPGPTVPPPTPFPPRWASSPPPPPRRPADDLCRQVKLGRLSRAARAARKLDNVVDDDDDDGDRVSDASAAADQAAESGSGTTASVPDEPSCACSSPTRPGLSCAHRSRERANSDDRG
ncbi:hypothetical protein VTH06DRAFT_7742 [Thermothelomyces fergusii]